MSPSEPETASRSAVAVEYADGPVTRTTFAVPRAITWLNGTAAVIVLTC